MIKERRIKNILKNSTMKVPSAILLYGLNNLLWSQGKTQIKFIKEGNHHDLKIVIDKAVQDAIEKSLYHDGEIFECDSDINMLANFRSYLRDFDPVDFDERKTSAGHSTGMEFDKVNNQMLMPAGFITNRRIKFR